MEEKLHQAFIKVMTNQVEQDIIDRLLRVIEKMSLQEKIFLFQLFQNFPDKIPAFWEVTKKKFEYIKNGIGDMDKIIEEEIQLFS